MQQYKILVGELFGDLEQRYPLGKEGDVVTLEQMTEEFIKTCLENGLIEAVPATVVEEAAPKGSPENPLSEEEAKEAGIDVEKVKAEAEVVDEVPVEAAAEETVAAPAVEEVAPAAPKKFYRGDLIIDEQPRTVGAQTFQHIKTGQGHEFDLTEAEYVAEVTTTK